MSHHHQINAAMQAIDAVVGDQGEDDDARLALEPWAVRRLLEGIGRDVVDAIDRHARYGQEQGDMEQRARGYSRELASTRVVVAEVAAAMTSDTSPLTDAEVIAYAQRLMSVLPTSAPAQQPTPSDD